MKGEPFCAPTTAVQSAQSHEKPIKASCDLKVHRTVSV